MGLRALRGRGVHSPRLLLVVPAGGLAVIRSQTESHNRFKPDITEQKRAEEALRACQLQLEQSQKLEALGQLAVALADDFNHLLTGLSLRQSDLQETAECVASLIRQLLAEIRQLLDDDLRGAQHTITDWSSCKRCKESSPYSDKRL